jgi:hypothetical protein
MMLGGYLMPPGLGRIERAAGRSRASLEPPYVGMPARAAPQWFDQSWPADGVDRRTAAEPSQELLMASLRFGLPRPASHRRVARLRPVVAALRDRRSLQEEPMSKIAFIGVGTMGSAACYHLAKRGAKVLGLEQFSIPHDRGSSHGQTRIIRKAYYEHPDYVPLLHRAYQRWYDLEQTQAAAAAFHSRYAGRIAALIRSDDLPSRPTGEHLHG